MILIVLVVGFFWLLSGSGFCKLGLFRLVELLYFIVNLVSSGIYLDKLLLFLILICAQF